jgi:hypothetical protein
MLPRLLGSVGMSISVFLSPTTPEAEKTPSLLDIYLAERRRHDGR